MADQNSILIIGESKDGMLSSTTREVMTIGRKLADDLQKPLCLCLLGKEPSDVAKKGFHYGADCVIEGSDPNLDPYLAEAYLQALIPFIQTQNPSIILLSHNDMGLDLAPRLSYELGTHSILDCEGVRVNPSNQQLTCLKPVFGGKAVSHFQFLKEGSHVITIREGAASPIVGITDRTGEVESMPVSIDPQSLHVRYLGKQLDENLALANQLNTSKLIIAAGRGLKNQEGVNLAAEAAEKMGGAIAASRPVVDNGWLPYSLQIGLTGKKVHPNVYIAAGISGAIQHMAGCMKSDTVIAINTDNSAPVFKMSKYGIVGDCKAVLESCIRELDS